MGDGVEVVVKGGEAEGELVGLVDAAGVEDGVSVPADDTKGLGSEKIKGQWGGHGHVELQLSDKPQCGLEHSMFLARAKHV